MASFTNSYLVSEVTLDQQIVWQMRLPSTAMWYVYHFERFMVRPLISFPHSSTDTELQVSSAAGVWACVVLCVVCFGVWRVVVLRCVLGPHACMLYVVSVQCTRENRRPTPPPPAVAVPYIPLPLHPITRPKMLAGQTQTGAAKGVGNLLEHFLLPPLFQSSQERFGDFRPCLRPVTAPSTARFQRDPAIPHSWGLFCNQNQQRHFITPTCLYSKWSEFHGPQRCRLWAEICFSDPLPPPPPCAALSTPILEGLKCWWPQIFGGGCRCNGIRLRLRGAGFVHTMRIEVAVSISLCCFYCLTHVVFSPCRDALAFALCAPAVSQISHCTALHVNAAPRRSSAGVLVLEVALDTDS